MLDFLFISTSIQIWTKRNPKQPPSDFFLGLVVVLIETLPTNISQANNFYNLFNQRWIKFLKKKIPPETFKTYLRSFESSRRILKNYELILSF